MTDETTNLANAHILITAWCEAQRTGDAESVSRFRNAVDRLAKSDASVARAYVDALAEFGDGGDLPTLISQLEGADRDLASSAAHAILRIERRLPHACSNGLTRSCNSCGVPLSAGIRAR